MSKFLKSLAIVFLSFILIDIFLSLIFNKDIYNQINNKIDIVATDLSRKQIDFSEVKDGIVPYWTSEYRGPYFDLSIDKKLNCRVLGIGDSIIWGSGVGGKDTYFKLLNDNIKNTEWINNGVPGHDSLQSIMKYNEGKLYNDTDLLIWHFWQDDNHIYKLIDGVLYNAKVNINEVGKPYLFGNNILDNFLLEKSYMYNKILKIKIKGEINSIEIKNDEYIINELEKLFKDFLSKNKDKKILIIFSPDLSNNTYKNHRGWDFDGYPAFYKKIEKSFSGSKNINLLYLDKFFSGVPVERIRYDDCCHFNEEGHKLISKKLYDYIKINKLLNEKCF